MKKCLLYPMGVGGHWLRLLIYNVPIRPPRTYNFHHNSQDSWVEITHDPSHNWVYFYSGESYLNFYLNQIFKYEHANQDLFLSTPYPNYWRRIVANANEICNFAMLDQRPTLRYEDLLYEPKKFLQGLHKIQTSEGVALATEEYFESSRLIFLASSADTSNFFENFDNPYWVAFVLGQLLTYNISPKFEIKDEENYRLCKRFAMAKYDQCHIKSLHQVINLNQLPKLSIGDSPSWSKAPDFDSGIPRFES